jgi:NAD(P)-dependent dehydrogenase (short-subunit alcohol dehydrogenase family)
MEGGSPRRDADGTEEVMQTALITGASRGIGRRVAERLADDGMRLLLAVRRIENAPRLPNGEALPLDVASPSSIAALVKQLSARRERLDVLVNNAGVYEAPRREIWNVNVRGPWLLTRGLMPLLCARVVMVTSGMAQGAADAALQKRLAEIDVEGDGFGKLADDAPGGYGASKAALNRMAELFAKELAPRGIKVNAISPGWVRTAMGGPGAPRSIDQGAESVLWGARLGANGPSGGFFEDGRPLRA